MVISINTRGPDDGYLAHIVSAIKREKGIRRQLLAFCREGMADLKERVYGEALVELGAQAGEGLVLEEDTALDLLGDLINCAGVAQAECCSSRVERLVCIDDLVEKTICARSRRCDGG